MTCISEHVVSAVGLRPQGQINVHGIAGPSVHNSYIFMIGLATQSHIMTTSGTIEDVHLLTDMILGPEIRPHPDYDVLLGMDALSAGQLIVHGTGLFSYSC